MRNRLVNLSFIPLIALAALLAFPPGTLAAQPTAVHDAWDFTDTITDACGVPGLTVEEHFTGEVDGFYKFVDGRSFPFTSVHVSFFNTFTGPNGKVVTVSADRREQDARIVDNGDGTITITSFGSGGSRFYDRNGKFVLKDPGEARFAFDIDYNGTPGDPDDDVEVPDSFRIVRSSTGHSDFSNRDFCADLVAFTR